MFLHPARQIRRVVHGDYFTALGTDKDLDWYRDLMKKRFEIKVRGHIGPEHSDQKPIRISNRVIEWTDSGIKYEMDQRHAEIIVSALRLSDSIGRQKKKKKLVIQNS